MRINIPISCDFSVSAINHMLDIGRQNNLGRAVSVYYNELEKNKAFNEWGIVFEDGSTVVSEAF